MALILIGFVDLFEESRGPGIVIPLFWERSTTP